MIKDFANYSDNNFKRKFRNVFSRLLDKKGISF